MQYDLIVIGGGAAGFYGAIQVAERKPMSILILEKSNKLLAKVKISGGGRCNVTHHCYEPKKLSGHYPRGEKLLKNLFQHHHARHVVEWFTNNGVELKVEDDGRMFPVTDSSQIIIDCFLEKARQHKIKIELGKGVKKIEKHEGFFSLETFTGDVYQATNVLIATGGHPTMDSYSWIKSLGHTIINPIPSLFTFNDSQKHFSDLMGVSVPGGMARIAGTKFLVTGPILITHWGLSGPAIIKLSAWAAEYLNEKKYTFQVLISWIGSISEEETRSHLHNYKSNHGKRKVTSWPLFDLPQRLWARLCELAEIPDEKIWMELSNRSFNKLMEGLIRSPFTIKGKTTFKEEFVTCGGVELSEINPETLGSKLIPGLYFAGEVLNIDGETGGFNFQAAWTTAYIAAHHIARDK
jgi:predicted Rossmann fold flavoprotein